MPVNKQDSQRAVRQEGEPYKEKVTIHFRLEYGYKTKIHFSRPSA